MVGLGEGTGVRTTMGGEEEEEEEEEEGAGRWERAKAMSAEESW